MGDIRPVSRGVVDERARRFSAAELRLAWLLAHEGHRVVAVATAPGAEGRVDAEIDGEPACFDTLIPRSTSTAVFLALARASRHGTSSVIDARGSGLAQRSVRAGMVLYFRAPGHRPLRSVRIVGDGFDERLP